MYTSHKSRHPVSADPRVVVGIAESVIVVDGQRLCRPFPDVRPDPRDASGVLRVRFSPAQARDIIPRLLSRVGTRTAARSGV
jgi:hypothetical protein